MTEKMEINGVSAEEIGGEYGTPLFVYNADKIREQYRKLQEAFGSRYGDFQINYAVKANFNPEIARLLVEEGAGLDCASKAEIKLAEEIGAEHVMYTAPYNREDELEYALEHDAFVNLDSIFLLEKIDEMPEEICFRIDPGIGSGDHGLVFGGGDTKFGVPEERAVEAYRKAKERGAERFGIHMMTGSNIRDPEYFGQITGKLLEIAGEISEELDIEFEFVDIGGGLGIPSKPQEEELDVDAAAGNIVNALEEGINIYDTGEPELRIEPGRFLVGEAGYLLTEVTGVKNKQDETFVGTDTGMHQLIRPMLYDAHHEIEPVTSTRSENKSEKDIVGCVCENDYLAQNYQLPEVEQGDILAIENVGAYGFVMSSNWNSRPLPAEVLVESNKSELIRERQEKEAIFHGTSLEVEK